jgi:4'-phosphopantetheinyl transferase
MPAVSPPPPSTSGTADHAWHRGPERPRLAENAIDVWRADLTTVPEEMCALLCDEELERAQRILNERSRRMWTSSRAVLRALLALYLDTEPAALRFAIGAHGKPALAGQPPQGSTAERGPMPASALRTQFNLSHSGHLALYAFAAGPSVGIDLELERRTVDEVAIAARTFGVAEAERLRELNPDSRRREFLRAWVRYEARLKCLGVGIGGSAAAASANSVPWIAELQMGPRGAGAVAVERAPREVRLWEWPNC